MTAKIPATEAYYLIGKDENRQFISQLSTRPKTISSAKKGLRPKGISSNAIRQGEWFFDPVSAKKSKELNSNGKKLYVNRQADWPGGLRFINISSLDNSPFVNAPGLERHSSHRCLGTMKTLNGQRYVKGAIADSRKGRHAKTFLEDWHKLVRNTEVINNDDKYFD